MNENYWSMAQKQRLMAEIRTYPYLISNVLLRSFFQHKGYASLQKRAWQHPSAENLKALEDAFLDFKRMRRFLSYVSQTLYWEAVKFDQRKRRYQQTFPLIVDTSSEDPEEGPFETVTAEENLEKDRMETMASTIEELCTEPWLIQAIQALTPAQKSVLFYVYKKGYTLTETASLLHTTPQNISNIHRRLLSYLAGQGGNGP